MLPKMAFTGFASRYREPTSDEGFEDITKVNFKVCWRSLRWHKRLARSLQYGSWVTDIPRQFNGTEAQKAQWRKYWVS